MGEYYLLHLLDSHLTVDHKCRAVDYLGSVITDHVDADYLAVLLVDDQLDDSVSAFVFGNIVKSVGALEIGQKIDVTLSDGSVTAEIKNKKEAANGK